jgi:hypothetical protein
MGEKAAMNEVIHKLVSTLIDENISVRWSACSALSQMGEKAATNEVINKLVNIIKNEVLGSYEAVNALANILSSSSVIIQLDPYIIVDLWSSEYTFNCFKNVSEDAIIKILFNTENSACLRGVAKFALSKGVGVTVTGGKVVIYSSKEPVEVYIPIGQFPRQLVETFSKQRRELHLEWDMA